MKLHYIKTLKVKTFSNKPFTNYNIVIASLKKEI